jgi:uncharacterized tellurite resistance protein B-like protein
MHTEPLAADDLHHLALLYLSVAYEADNDFDPAEHHTVLSLVQRWAPSLTAFEANGIVDVALKGLRSGLADAPEALARTLGATLSLRQRRRVLADLGLVARADGFLTVQEAQIIRRIRVALEAPSGDGGGA